MNKYLLLVALALFPAITLSAPINCAKITNANEERICTEEAMILNMPPESQQEMRNELRKLNDARNAKIMQEQQHEARAAELRQQAATRDSELNRISAAASNDQEARSAERMREHNTAISDWNARLKEPSSGDLIPGFTEWAESQEAERSRLAQAEADGLAQMAAREASTRERVAERKREIEAENSGGVYSGITGFVSGLGGFFIALSIAGIPWGFKPGSKIANSLIAAGKPEEEPPIKKTKFL